MGQSATLPTLSVVVPNYNHAKYLPACLTAILRESVQPLEVLVLDDVSTDNSVEVIRSFAARHPLVRLIQNEQNLGVMRNTSGVNTGDALVSIYKADAQSDIKRAVVNSLFIQRNAKALVDLARAEKDASMKREIVQKLSVMKEPVATEYMLELLK